MITLNAEDVERFWQKVQKGDGCWLWSGAHAGGTGYGCFQLSRNRGRSRTLGAHRVAWIVTNGAIPPRMWICHRCDNPGCVRPDHLFVGTPSDNGRDMVAKGRCGCVRRPDLVRRGEQINTARLTEAQVAEIYTRYRAGKASQVALRREFGVSECIVYEIVRDRTWRHVTQPIAAVTEDRRPVYLNAKQRADLAKQKEATR